MSILTKRQARYVDVYIWTRGSPLTARIYLRRLDGQQVIHLINLICLGVIC